TKITSHIPYSLFSDTPQAVQPFPLYFPTQRSSDLVDFSDQRHEPRPSELRPEAGRAGSHIGSHQHYRRRAAGSTQGAKSTGPERDRKRTRLNSSHGSMSYAVFCLKEETDEIE